MSHVSHSTLLDEILEAGEAVRRQEGELSRSVSELASHLRRRPPRVVVTCGRGTSAHAATFAKYVIEQGVEVPVAAAAPSIASVYGRRLRLDDQLFLTISQSGQSSDLVAMARAAKEAGAFTAALVNATDSPLAAACDLVLPMMAGPERSVAATKTFIASLAALVRLAAAWWEDAELAAAIRRLPDRLNSAAELDWGEASRSLAAASSLATIGRGPTLAIAREAALKLKETCGLHAEAFSGAEFRHGPIAMVERGYPVLLFAVQDASARELRQLAADLREKRCVVLSAEVGPSGKVGLPVLPPDHPYMDAICMIQSFYVMLVGLAAARGFDVNRPRHIQKVTSTT